MNVKKNQLCTNEKYFGGGKKLLNSFYTDGNENVISFILIPQLQSRLIYVSFLITKILYAHCNPTL